MPPTIPNSPGWEALREGQEQMYQSFGLRRPAPQDLESIIRSRVQEGTAAQLYPKADSKEIEAYSRRKLEEIQMLLKESPPTPFEDLSTYVNILAVAHDLEEAARNSSDHLVLKRPIFGTLPLGGVNAVNIREGTDYIVAFSVGLFSFAELMARSLATTVQYTGVNQGILPHTPQQPMHGFSFETDAIRQSLQGNTAPAKCFIEAILSYVRLGRPDASNMLELDPARNAFATIIYRFFLEFVVAHEYGHIFHHHLDQKIQDVPAGAGTARTVMWDWRKEAEADVAACGLMMVRARARPINLPALLMGVEVFLSCYEMLDRAVSVLSVGDEEYVPITVGHPPARARRGFLHHHLLSRCKEFLEGPDAEVQMRSALKDALRLYEVVNILWEQARPYLWRLYEIGRSPAKIFHQGSDSKSSADPAMLGETRRQLKELLPVAGTLERSETLVVSGKSLVRTCANALFKGESESGLTEIEIETAQTAISAALGGVGQALGVAGRVLGELRSVLVKDIQGPLDAFQTAVDKAALAGARLEAAEQSKRKATILRESAKFIREAGDSLVSVGEISGVGQHFVNMGDCLELASQALARDTMEAFWRNTKLAGYMAVLSGECLIRGAVELWRIQLLPVAKAALLSMAEILRQEHLPPLGNLHDVLSLYKEAGYALISSLRRSAAFFRNVALPFPEAEAKFRTAASVFKADADLRNRIVERIAAAESEVERVPQQGDLVAALVETGQILESVAKTLDQAVIKEQELGLQSALGHIAKILSSAAMHLADHNPALAAQSMEENVYSF